MASKQTDTCRSGHAFTPENTHTRKNGQRNCRTCRRERMAVRYQQQYKGGTGH